MLCAIARKPRITALQISSLVGITERATRKIIADLEADGYVTKKREGRNIKYRIDPDLPLRHEMQEDKAVGDLLEALGWKRRRKKTQEEKPVPQAVLL